MDTLKRIIFTAFACLAFVPGMRAQQYRWSLSHPGVVPIPGSTASYVYSFSAVDCYGEVCTAAGTIGGSAFTGTHLMFFRSTNGGLTWADQDPDLQSSMSTEEYVIQKVQQIDSINAVGIGNIWQSSGLVTGFVFRTFDGGLTWERQGIHNSETIEDVHFSDPMTGIIILDRPTSSWTACDIETTKDGGKTWTLAPFSPWIFGASCHSDGGDNFRVIPYDGRLYSTTDDWQTVDSTAYIVPLDDSVHNLPYFNYRGKDTIIGTGATGNGNPQILYIDESTDGGQHWDSTTYNGHVFVPFGMSSLDRDIVFMGVEAYTPQLAVSMDHGITWQIDTMILDSNYDAPWPLSVAVTPRNEAIVVLGGPVGSTGVLLRGTPASDGIAETSVTDETMHVFPNPATQNITVSSVAAQHPLQILDVLGREVKNGTVPASGSLTLDISDLPSGLYYVSDNHSHAKFLKE